MCFTPFLRPSPSIEKKVLRFKTEETLESSVSELPTTKRQARVLNDFDSIFVPGVGNVVLQVSATAQVRKCFGVEKADIPAAYAAEMLKQFRFWMKFYGKPYSPVNVS